MNKLESDLESEMRLPFESYNITIIVHPENNNVVVIQEEFLVWPDDRRQQRSGIINHVCAN